MSLLSKNFQKYTLFMYLPEIAEKKSGIFSSFFSVIKVAQHYVKILKQDELLKLIRTGFIVSCKPRYKPEHSPL